MTVLYLHVEMPKTGTSSIQCLLAANRAVLDRHGVAYPDMSDLFDQVSNRRNAHWLAGDEDAGRVREAFGRIRGLAETHEKIVLSDERLWKTRVTSNVFWSGLLESLGDIELKVAVWLRRQDKWLYSNWTQGVQSMAEVDFKTLDFESYLERGVPDNLHLDYGATLDAIAKSVGAENIIVGVYEPCQLAGGSSTSDFLAKVGIDFAGELDKVDLRANPSLRDSVLEAKRRLNSYQAFSGAGELEHSPAFKRVLFSVQKDLEDEGLLGKRTGFPASERRRLMERYAAGNEHVARTYLGRESGVLFTEEIADDGTDVSWEFDEAEIMEVCARTIAELEGRLERARKINGRLRAQSRGEKG